MYQKFGVMADYFAGRDDLDEADAGRFTVTGDSLDLHSFKVPSLRSVALTAPYFHDASAPTLAAAIAVMGEYQLGRQLEPDEILRLIAFLQTLTGAVPTAALPAADAQP